MRRPLIPAALLVLAAATPALAADTGRSYDAGTRGCRFTDPRIGESSGVATSSTRPGALWTHNDSGDTSRWFLVDGTTCATLATYRLDLPGVPAVGGESPTALDWEDMTRGVTADGRSTLLFGDIGDNQQARPVKTVYEVVEPSGTVPAGSTPQTEQPVPVLAVLAVVLPTTPVDAESLLFVRQTRQLGIVSKTRDAAGAYTGMSHLYVSAAPVAETTGPVTMTDAGLIDVTALPRQNPGDSDSIAATSADMAPDGRHLVVRAYFDAYEYAVGPTYDLAAAIAAPPLHVPLLRTKQGEAITYGDDGRSLITTTEGSGTDGDPTSGVVDRYRLLADGSPAAALPELPLPALAVVAGLGVLAMAARRQWLAPSAADLDISPGTRR